jgi:hypothetical protein
LESAAILSKHTLTTFKSEDQLEGDLVVNAHQTSYGGFVETEGSEVEGGFGPAGDRAITIEGGDALEGDLLGHAVYGEIAGNLYAGALCPASPGGSIAGVCVRSA